VSGEGCDLKFVGEVDRAASGRHVLRPSNRFPLNCFGHVILLSWNRSRNALFRPECVRHPAYPNGHSASRSSRITTSPLLQGAPPVSVQQESETTYTISRQRLCAYAPPVGRSRAKRHRDGGGATPFDRGYAKIVSDLPRVSRGKRTVPREVERRRRASVTSITARPM
jgi:hypothetical protein